MERCDEFFSHPLLSGQWDEAAFAAMAEGLPLVVWTHGAGGKIDFVNRRFREYFEFSLSGVTDLLHWSSVMHPIDFDAAIPAISRCLVYGIPYEVELRLKPFSAAESAFRRHLMRVRPIVGPGGGDIRKWVGSALDIHSSHGLPASGDQWSAAQLKDNVLDLFLDTADVVAAHRCLDFIMGFLRAHAGSRVDYQALRLVYFELIGNAVKYAPGRLMLRVDRFGEVPALHIFDRGAGFDYRPTLPSDILAEGGRGLYLVNSLTGSLSVHRLPGCGSHITVPLPAPHLPGIEAEKCLRDGKALTP